MIRDLSPDDAGGYRALVRDGSGEVTSETADLTVNPPAPDYAWVRALNSLYLRGYGMDAQDNAYLSGYFHDSIRLGGTEFTASDVSEFLLVRFTPDGELASIVTLGSTDHTYPEGGRMAVDDEGNCFIFGYMRWNFDFGMDDADADGVEGRFLAKFDSHGEPLWASRIDGALYDERTSLAVDREGNCYLTGMIDSHATFGTTTFTDDAYVAKYSSTGDLQWVTPGVGAWVGGTIPGIGVDAAGYSYVTGLFRGETFSLGDATTEGPGDMVKAYLARLNSEGEVLWLKSTGGSGSAWVVAAAVDDSGGIYLTGTAGEGAEFGSKTLSDSGLFLAKYGATGTPEWVTSSGGETVVGMALAVEPSGFIHFD